MTIKKVGIWTNKITTCQGRKLYTMTSKWRDGMLKCLCDVPKHLIGKLPCFGVKDRIWIVEPCDSMSLRSEMPIVLVMIKRHVWSELWINQCGWQSSQVWIIGWFWFLWGKTSNLLQYWKMVQIWSMVTRKPSFTSSTLNVKGWHDMERGVRANKYRNKGICELLKRESRERSKLST